MSMKAPILYMREIMKNLGHKEWTEAFDDANIPDSITDRAYHLFQPPSSLIKQNQELIEINQQIRVRLYVKGYKNPAAGRDRALDFGDEIIQNSCAPKNKFSNKFPGVRNVNLVSCGAGEMSVENDNVIRLEMVFNFLLLLAPN